MSSYLLDIHQLPELLGRSPETIKRDLRRDPWAFRHGFISQVPVCCGGAERISRPGLLSTSWERRYERAFRTTRLRRSSH